MSAHRTDRERDGAILAASRTAVAVAALRAAHRLFDAKPYILDDPIAWQLLESDVRDRLVTASGGVRDALGRALRAHVVVRSRFTEDHLAEAVRRGVAQYVILGAGLDTFAWRQPAWARSIRIFEVDHPASQRDKQDRLARAGLGHPPNLALVPVNFETEALAARLADAGLDRERPVFFSWLGVTPYLNEAAIDEVLRVIAALPAGTELALTFAAAGDDTTSRVAARAAALGEMFRSYFTPAQFEAKLAAFGFGTIAMLTPDESAARYFAGRTDGFAPPRRTSIAWARRD